MWFCLFFFGFSKTTTHLHRKEQDGALGYKRIKQGNKEVNVLSTVFFLAKFHKNTTANQKTELSYDNIFFVWD